MPVVDPNTGEPVSDAPDQEDENLAGGKGRGEEVSATESPREGSGIASGPDNPRESQPGATQGDSGNSPGGSNATGGA